MKAYERFHEIQNVGYFLNGLSISDVKFTNIAHLWHDIYGRDDC